MEKKYEVRYEVMTDWKHIRCQLTRHIVEDGKLIASSNIESKVLTPDMDLNSMDNYGKVIITDEIRGMATILWTDEVKKSWTEHLKKLEVE